MINLDPSRTLLGWLVRHGELSIGARWDGWGEYTLSEKGIESAEKAAQWLSFEKVGRIVSSDVPRTIQTANIIMSACNVACPFIGTEPNIRPLMVAGFTGQEKTPERLKQFAYYMENPDEVIPGGESRNQLNQRIQVIQSYLCTPYDGLPTCLVCHNSVIKSFTGLDDMKDAVAPGGIVAVYMNEDGNLECDVVLGKVEPERGVS